MDSVNRFLSKLERISDLTVSLQKSILNEKPQTKLSILGEVQNIRAHIYELHHYEVEALQESTGADSMCIHEMRSAVIKMFELVVESWRAKIVQRLGS